MATTGQNFVYTGGTSTLLNGTTVGTAPYVLGLDPVSAGNAVNAAPVSGTGVASGFLNNSAQPIDRVIFDLGLGSRTPGFGTMISAAAARIVGGFAKNGALAFTMTGTTPVTVDFTDISATIGVTNSYAGDTTVTTMNALIIINASAVASTVVVIPAASNPLTMPCTAVWTSRAVLLGNIMAEYAAIGKTVDASHKGLTFTPTVGGTILIAFGGA